MLMNGPPRKRVLNEEFPINLVWLLFSYKVTIEDKTGPCQAEMCSPLPLPVSAGYQGSLHLTRGVYPIIYRNFTKGARSTAQIENLHHLGRVPDEY
jgi:hypothetical protein